MSMTFEAGYCKLLHLLNEYNYTSIINRKLLQKNICGELSTKPTFLEMSSNVNF